MSKKSGKKKSQKPQTAKPAPKKHYLVRKKSDGTFDVDWTMFQVNTNPVNHMIQEHNGQIPTSIVYKSLKKAYLKQTANNDGISEYLEKSAIMKTRLTKQFGIWLSDCVDANPDLDRYSSSKSFDTIDFKDYVKSNNIMHEALQHINENPDISTLWSVSPVIDIFINESVSYRVHRVLYDNINNAMRYCIYEYTKFRISDNDIIEIPTMQIVINVDIVKIRNMSEIIGLNTISADSYMSDKMQRNIIETTAKLSENPNEFYTLRIGIMGCDSPLSTERHLELYHSHWAKPTYRNIRDRIREFCFDIYGGNQNGRVNLIKEKQAEHQIIAPSIVMAAIIVTNKYLKNKKLSKPVTDNIRHEVEIILENQPERKTRMLGNKIRITSEKRPQAPDTERIIKYHTPSWQRKGYLRRLKSGKLVEVKPSICTRRCVDMTKIKSNQEHSVTDYVIKSERIMEENNNA